MNDQNGGKPRPRTSVGDQWTHRQALQVLAQLPDDQQEALAVLDRARALLEMWSIGDDQIAEATIHLLRPKAAGS